MAIILRPKLEIIRYWWNRTSSVASMLVKLFNPASPKLPAYENLNFCISSESKVLAATSFDANKIFELTSADGLVILAR